MGKCRNTTSVQGVQFRKSKNVGFVDLVKYLNEFNNVFLIKNNMKIYKRNIKQSSNNINILDFKRNKCAVASYQLGNNT